MIVGIGSDLCNIERIQKSLDRWGGKFLERVFTGVEQKKAESRPHTRAGTLAKRFAAKEACAKALGTGMSNGVFWRDMGVVNLPSGRPTLVLTGGARLQLQRITPPDCEARIDLTITDDFPHAQAIVIISGLPTKLDPR